MQKTRHTDHSENQKTETQPFSKDLQRLKKAWEHLQKMQAETLGRLRKSKAVGQISSVRIITDQSGKQSVRVDLVGGGRITDIGDKRDVFQKMMPKRKVNIGKIISLLDAVRLYGFAAVAMGLSPAMKALLLKACKNCNVPLRPKQEKTFSHTLKSAANNTFLPNKDNSFQNNPATTVSRIDSLPFLDEMIARQKAENNARLKDLLQRTQEKAREEYFDQIRTTLTEIEQKQRRGEPLSEEELKLQKQAERFGLKTDKSKEVINDYQKEERRALPLRELPENIQKKQKSAEQRYRAICSSKNKAAELIRTIHAQEIENKHSLFLSPNDLAREAAAYLPPPEQRDMKNLTASMEKIQSQTIIRKDELKKTRQERQDRASALMAKTMSAAVMKQTKAHRQIKTIEKHPEKIQRQSFLSNAVMQELINRRQAER